MLWRVETEKVLTNFFAGNLSRVKEFGIEPSTAISLDKAYGIEGLSRAIKKTFHVAKWRMVVFDKEFGLDLAVGPPGQESTMRYFPEVWPDEESFHPKQFPRLYLTPNSGESQRFDNCYLVIEGCDAVNSSIIFKVKQQERGGGRTPTSVTISLRDGRCEVKYPNQNNLTVQSANPQPSLF